MKESLYTVFRAVSNVSVWSHDLSLMVTL